MYYNYEQNYILQTTTNDDALDYIEIEYGLAGYGLYMKMLNKIYSNGYFYYLGEMQKKVFSKKNRIKISKLEEIINDCLEYGIFDKTLYTQYNILTSKDIQIQYLKHYNDIKEEFCLLSNKNTECEPADALSIDTETEIKNLSIDTKAEINNLSIDTELNNQIEPSTEKTSSKTGEITDEKQKSIENIIRAEKQPKNGKMELADTYAQKETAKEEEKPVIDAVYMELPLKTGGTHKIRDSDLEELESLYPECDIESELRSMKAWLISNENKQKQKAGIKRFINSWLNRSKERLNNQQLSFNNLNDEVDEADEELREYFYTERDEQRNQESINELLAMQFDE